MGEASPVSREGGEQGFQEQFTSWEADIGLLLVPLQELWVLTTGEGGAFKGLEMT